MLLKKMERHAFFLVLMAISVIYLHVAPMLCMAEITPQLRKDYLLVQGLVVLFFEMPLVYFYFWFLKRPLRPVMMKELREPDVMKTFLIAAVVSVFLFIFLKVAVQYGLLYRRVGHEGLSRRSLAVPFVQMIIYRIYAESGIFISLLLVSLLTRAAKAKQYLKAVPLSVVFLLQTLVYGGYVFINNRFQTGIFLVTHFVVICFLNKDIRGRVFNFLRICIFTVIFVSSMKVVSNVRMYLDYKGELDFGVLNLFDSTPPIRIENGEMVEDKLTPTRWRLNGIDLMAQITRPAFDTGFLWGKAWETPIMLNWYAFADHEKFVQIKKDIATNSKVMVIQHYLGKKMFDYFSSALSDLYANFFFLAFPLAALFYAFALNLICRSFDVAKNLTLVTLFSFYALNSILYFEKEFVTVLIDLFKFSPVFLIVLTILWLKPGKSRDQIGAASASLS